MKTFCLQMRALVKLSFLELWRRNDIFGLLILGLALMVPLSMASPFGSEGASRYLDEMALLLIWGFSLFIALGTGSRLFPPEFESRTIFPLLAKPISRGRLLFGKYLGAVAATWSALLFFYLLFAGSNLLRGGALSIELFQAVVLHLAFAAFAVSVSLPVGDAFGEPDPVGRPPDVYVLLRTQAPVLRRDAVWRVVRARQGVLCCWSARGVLRYASASDPRVGRC